MSEFSAINENVPFLAVLRQCLYFGAFGVGLGEGFLGGRLFVAARKCCCRLCGKKGSFGGAFRRFFNWNWCLFSFLVFN